MEAQKARVELARARVQQAELDLEYTTIVSPTHGHVTRKRAEPGLMISRGQPLMAVVPLNAEDLWVTANFKKPNSLTCGPGQSVEIRVDAYPGIALKGTVESIMAGTGAAFSLFPRRTPQGTTCRYAVYLCFLRVCDHGVRSTRADEQRVRDLQLAPQSGRIFRRSLCLHDVGAAGPIPPSAPCRAFESVRSGLTINLDQLKAYLSYNLGSLADQSELARAFIYRQMQREASALSFNDTFYVQNRHIPCTRGIVWIIRKPPIGQATSPGGH